MVQIPNTNNFQHVQNLFSFSWLQAFLDRLLIKVVARINATRKNQEEKEQMKNEVERRLRTLKEETEEVRAS